MAVIVKSKIFLTLSFLFLLLCKQGFALFLEVPTIKAGEARIIGRIILPEGTNKDNIQVTVGVPHPISGEYVRYNTLVNQAGSFSIDVDVETTTSLIAITSSLNLYKSFFVKIPNGAATQIDLTYTADLDPKNIQVSPEGLNQNDMTRGMDVINKVIAYRPTRVPEAMYAEPTDYFLNHVKMAVSERLQILDHDTLISKKPKRVVVQGFTFTPL